MYEMMEVRNLPYSPSHFSDTERDAKFMLYVFSKTSLTYAALSSLSTQ
jgi:hypothetical protein